MNNSILLTIFKLLNKKQKTKIIFLFILVSFSILFEMLSIGIFLPVITLISSKDIALEYPSLIPILKLIGNPNQINLIKISMFLIAFIFIVKSMFILYLTYAQTQFGSLLTYELNNKIFKGYLNQEYIFHLQNNSAILLRNIQNINQFTTVTQAIINLGVEISLVISIFLFMIFIEPIGSISVAFFLLFFVGIFQTFTKNKLIKWGYSKHYFSGQANLQLLQV